MTAVDRCLKIVVQPRVLLAPLWIVLFCAFRWSGESSTAMTQSNPTADNLSTAMPLYFLACAGFDSTTPYKQHRPFGKRIAMTGSLEPNMRRGPQRYVHRYVLYRCNSLDTQRSCVMCFCVLGIGLLEDSLGSAPHVQYNY